MYRIFLSLLAIFAAAAAASPSADAQVTQKATETRTVSQADVKEMVEPVFDAASVFENLDFETLDLIPVPTRREMVIYARNDSTFEAATSFGNKAKIITLSDDYLKAEITPSSSLQIKILPFKKRDKIAMVIYTVGNDTQAADSNVTFLDSRYKQIDGKKMLKDFELKRFFDIPGGSLTSMKELREMIPFPVYEILADGNSDNIAVKLTSTKYLGDDDRHIAEIFLIPEIQLSWNGSKFEYVKRK